MKIIFFARKPLKTPLTAKTGIGMKFFEDEKKYRMLLLIALFLVFLTLRLFVREEFLLLSGDYMKFIETADNFPNHTLYNNQLYVLHPPLYPYVIYFMKLITGSYVYGSILVSLVTAAALFWILYFFLMYLSNNFVLSYFTLVFFTLSNNMINAGYSPLRESLVMALLIGAIFSYLIGIREKKRRHLVYAAILGGISALTSDHGIFLIPAFAITYLIFNKEKPLLFKFKFPNLGWAIMPALVVLIFFGMWLGIKAHAYSSNPYYPYYPIGASAVPIDVSNYNLFNLIQPQSFPTWDSSLPKAVFEGPIQSLKRYASQLGYMFNMEPFSLPRGLNLTTREYLLKPYHVAYIFLIYLPLFLIAVFGFFTLLKNALSEKKIHQNLSLYIFLLFLLFIFPILSRFTGPRYYYTAYLFFFYFIAYGIVSLSNYFSDQKTKKIMLSFGFLLLLVILFWMFNNTFLFNVHIEPMGPNTADYINKNIPKDKAIMLQPGYIAVLNHLVDNRILGLHAFSEDLDSTADHFNIDYFIFSRYFTKDAHHFSQEAAEYIQTHPEKYRLVATINEDYTDFFVQGDKARTDEVYIYERINR